MLMHGCAPCFMEISALASNPTQPSNHGKDCGIWGTGRAAILEEFACPVCVKLYVFRTPYYVGIRIIGHVAALLGSRSCPSLAEPHIPGASIPRNRNALSFLFLFRFFIFFVVNPFLVEVGPKFNVN